jgi:hypothetical protein
MSQSPRFTMGEGRPRLRTPHGFVDPLADEPRPLRPEEMLAAQILRLAVRDLREGRPGLRTWWASNDEPLGTLCECIGADVEAVRQRALAAPPRKRGRHADNI